MNPIDKKLFNLYCDPILQDAENYDEAALRKLLDEYSLTGEAAAGCWMPSSTTTSSGPWTPSPWASIWAYPSAVMSAAEAPSRSSSAWGGTSTWAPIFPPEM